MRGILRQGKEQKRLKLASGSGLNPDRPPLPLPPPRPTFALLVEHSYPAGGPAAVPPPQDSEQPFHRAAGLHGGWLAGLLAARPEQCWGLAWGFLEAAWLRQPFPLGGGEAV